MRIQTLAVCTLAAIAAQDLSSQASADSLPATEPTPDVNSHHAADSISGFSTARLVPETNVQAEFSHFTPSPNPAERPHAAPAVAQTTSVDDLNAPPSGAQPGQAAPTAPTTPAQPTSQPSSNQLLEDSSSPAPTAPAPEPPAATPPAAPASPAPSPPASSSPAPASSTPAAAGLVTEPIAPRVQIGNLVLPARGALPIDFVFPIQMRVTVNSSITTNTPITNSTTNLAIWEERVRACLDQKPQLYSVQTDGTLVPVLFDNQQGSILRNGNGRMVCSST